MSTAVHTAQAQAPDEVRPPWATMPGWGIFADLTPPEVVADRRVRAMRRRVLLGLGALVLACGLVYVVVLFQQARATDAVAVEASSAEDLLDQARRYAEVPEVQGATAQTEEQIARMMSGDVDFSALLRTLRIQLPDDMTITELSVDLEPTDAAAVAAADAQPGDTVDIDTSSRPRIGTVTISGGARGVGDVAAFLDRLAIVPGLITPLPLTNESSETGVRYSVRVTVNEVLLSHRFDLEPK